MTEETRNSRPEDLIVPIREIGDDVVLILPKAVQEGLKLRPGDSLHVVELTPDGMTLSPHNRTHWKGLQIARRMMVKYAETLKALAK